ncbi:MAG: hypothetical protein KDN20_02705 [Verrucomicrobiae bacterium]|nr:hypothetical protein [Verrucomicrobiae bacterium]
MKIANLQCAGSRFWRGGQLKESAGIGIPERVKNRLAAVIQTERIFNMRFFRAETVGVSATHQADFGKQRGALVFRDFLDFFITRKLNRRRQNRRRERNPNGGEQSGNEDIHRQDDDATIVGLRHSLMKEV